MNDNMRNILAVEDDFLNRRFTKNLLLQEGFQVFEAKDGPEAMAMLEYKEINIAILDINLGANKDDGIQLGQRIREKYDISLIYLTAYETSDIIRKAVSSQPIAYLTKPLKRADLIAAIELCMNQQQDTNLQTLVLKEDDYNIRIPIKSIDFIESEKNYIIIHSQDKIYKLRSTIKEIMSKLPDDLFIQTHRAYIVNIAKIEKYNNKNLQIGLHSIPVSSNYSAHVKNVFLD
ncbi:MAG: response regulator transcription factor [Chitinophagales bacterium]|nr:response regulator transcription factor [Chitinophagales bacterium]